MWQTESLENYLDMIIESYPRLMHKLSGFLSASLQSSPALQLYSIIIIGILTIWFIVPERQKIVGVVIVM